MSDRERFREAARHHMCWYNNTQGCPCELCWVATALAVLCWVLSLVEEAADVATFDYIRLAGVTATVLRFTGVAGPIRHPNETDDEFRERLALRGEP